LWESIDDFLKGSRPSYNGFEGDMICAVAVYGVEVSTAFTRNIEVELGVNRKYHTDHRGWLCDVSNKPLNMRKVYDPISSFCGDNLEKIPI
jgi:hypothetical protein